jgi:hypothetical protein
MATDRPSGSFAVDVLGPSLVAAVGMSLVFIPSLGTALSTARPEEGGLALRTRRPADVQPSSAATTEQTGQAQRAT